MTRMGWGRLVIVRWMRLRYWLLVRSLLETLLGLLFSGWADRCRYVVGGNGKDVFRG